MAEKKFYFDNIHHLSFESYSPYNGDKYILALSYPLIKRQNRKKLQQIRSY